MKLPEKLQNLGRRRTFVGGSVQRSENPDGEVPVSVQKSGDLEEEVPGSVRKYLESAESETEKCSKVLEKCRIRDEGNVLSQKGVFKKPERSVQKSIPGLWRNAPFTSTFCLSR